MTSRSMLAAALAATVLAACGSPAASRSLPTGASVVRATQSVTTYTYTPSSLTSAPCQESTLSLTEGTTYVSDTNVHPQVGGQPPTIQVAACNFTLGHRVQVTLATPNYGHPTIVARTNGFGIDAPDDAEVTATVTDIGDPLEGPSGGVSAQVTVTIAY